MTFVISHSDPGAVPGASTKMLGKNTLAGAKQDRRGCKDCVFVRHGTHRHRAIIVVANDNNYVEARVAA